jgi:hypothetical protein
MGPLTQQEYQALLDASDICRKYKEAIDPKSAFEILSERVLAVQQEEEQVKADKHGSKAAPKSARAQKSTFEEVMTSPVAKQVGRELVRGVFGMLFGSTSRRRR